MLENEDAYIRMGKEARRVFEEKYTAERNFRILMNIYNMVIEKIKSKSKRKIIPGNYFTFSQKWNSCNKPPIRCVVLQGVKILPVDIGAALQHIIDHIPHTDGGYYCLANIHVVIESHRDTVLKNALNGAAAAFAGGMGAADASRILGHRFDDRTKVYQRNGY